MRYPPTGGPSVQQSLNHSCDIGRESSIVNPKIVCDIYRPRSLSASAYLQDHGLTSPSAVVPSLEPIHRHRSVSLGPTALLGPTVAIGKTIELPNSTTVTSLDALTILGLISEPRKANLNTSATSQLNPSLRHDPSLKTRSSRFPALPENSAGMKFLSQFWHFPSDARYCKSTPGALEGYTQSNFEVLVTAGYILDDSIGFKWTCNGKYLLFKHDNGTNEDGIDCRGQRSHLGDLHYTSYAHKLFSQLVPDTTEPAPTSSEHTATPTPSNAVKLHKRRALKPTQPTTSSSSTQLQHSGFTPTPLPHPWTFPPNALYKESFPLSTSSTTERALEADVTAGHLISDDTGLKTANSQQYILLYVGERNDDEKFYTPRISREELPERPATPIVVVDGDEERTGDAKSARFNARCLRLDEACVVCEGRVVDNEGKTVGMYGGEGGRVRRVRRLRRGRR